MQLVKQPNKQEWANLIERPVINQEQLTQAVSSIITDVKQNGDNALIKYASLFDDVELSSLTVSEAEIEKAKEQDLK